MPVTPTVRAARSRWRFPDAGILGCNMPRLATFPLPIDLWDLFSTARRRPLLQELADNRAQTCDGIAEAGGTEAMNDAIADLLAAYRGIELRQAEFAL